MFVGSHAQHQITLCCQLADARVFQRLEWNDQQVSGVGVQPSQQAIALILRMPLDKQLRGQTSPVFDIDGYVNVGRATGIAHWLDGSKIIFAVDAGGEPAKALKIRVLTFPISTPRMQINAIGITLPDFDLGVSDWVSLDIFHLARQMSYFTHGGGDGIVQNQQIVIRIQWESVRIERPFGHPGRDKLFGKEARMRKKNSSGQSAHRISRSPQKFAAGKD